LDNIYDDPFLLDIYRKIKEKRENLLDLCKVEKGVEQNRNLYLELFNIILENKAKIKKYEEMFDLDKFKLIIDYNTIEKSITNKEIHQKYDHKNKMRIMGILCTILYNDGSIKQIDPYYKSIWNQTPKSNTKAMKLFRQKFLHFAYLKENNVYKIQTLDLNNNKIGTIDKYIEKYPKRNTKLFKFLTELMKNNKADYNKEYRIYIAVYFIEHLQFVYIGKCKDKTSKRWGYKNGHLGDVHNYIMKGGSCNLPKQYVDLWGLYLGPENFFIMTIETGVDDIKPVDKKRIEKIIEKKRGINDVNKKFLSEKETAYQYFFTQNKEKLNITGFLFQEKFPGQMDPIHNEKFSKLNSLLLLQK
jgi:hypothetical protein